MQTPKNSKKRPHAENDSPTRPGVMQWPGTPRKLAAVILRQAETAEPGAWAEGLLSMFPPAIFQVDFDGTGRVLVNPSSFGSNLTAPLLNELRRQGGARVQVGWWRGDRARIITREDVERWEARRAGGKQ